VETRRDFVVGLVIVVTVGVVLGALIATSGWGEGRYDVYMRTPSAEGITVDSRVILQGLEVGRVRSVSPRVDSASRQVSFVARLSIRERFDDGSELGLPVGTRAELVQVSQISTDIDIHLLLPDTVGRIPVMLAAGDTVNATRRGSALETITAVAGDLSNEVKQVLQQTTRTLVKLQGTLAKADASVDAMLPDVRATVATVSETMTRVDALVAEVHENALADSLTATLAASGRLLARLDSLTATAHAMVVDNRAVMDTTMRNLLVMSRQLNHFVEQMSARPYRMVTGVRPLPPDSAASGAASSQPKP
jgi:ABC-type transporter Mla subunit MlaD